MADRKLARPVSALRAEGHFHSAIKIGLKKAGAAEIGRGRNRRGAPISSAARPNDFR
jgi:hypothetical protein